MHYVKYGIPHSKYGIPHSSEQVNKRLRFVDGMLGDTNTINVDVI